MFECNEEQKEFFGTSDGLVYVREETKTGGLKKRICVWDPLSSGSGFNPVEFVCGAGGRSPDFCLGCCTVPTRPMGSRPFTAW